MDLQVPGNLDPPPVFISREEREDTRREDGRGGVMVAAPFQNF